MSQKFKSIKIGAKDISLHYVTGTRPAIQGSHEVLTVGGIIALNSKEEIEQFNAAWFAYKEDNLPLTQRKAKAGETDPA